MFRMQLRFEAARVAEVGSLTADHSEWRRKGVLAWVNAGEQVLLPISLKDVVSVPLYVVSQDKVRKYFSGAPSDWA